METANTPLFNNKKLQDFLSLLREEIELNETNAESIKSIGIEYKKLKTIFDDDEITKYLKYSEKKGFIKLRFISKQQIRDKKIPNKIYVSKITPDHTLIKPEVFYAVKRYYKINFYPNDIFIFEYNKHNIQKIENFFNEPNESPNGTKLNLSNLSMENLERLQKVLKIILDELELQDINRLTFNKIPLKRFEKEGFSYEEIKTLLYGIDDKHDIIGINNDYLKEKYEEIKIPGTSGNEPFLKTIYNVSVEDLKNYLLITAKDFNKLKEIAMKVSRKIGGINKAKKEKPEEQGSKLIIVEETKKNAQIIADRLNKSFAKDRQTFKIVRAWFDALSTSTAPALEAYQQAVKNTEIQIEPFRRKLEENARVINAITKKFIMPNFEAIKPILKDIEEKTKKVNEIYNQSKEPLSSGTILSPKIIEAGQRSEIVSEIKKLRERVEELSYAKASVAPQTTAQQPVITPEKPERAKAKSSKKKEPVRKIIIINMNDGRQLVAVDDNNETKVIRGYAECWKILIKEIKDRNIDQEQRTGVKDISDAVVDYFNTNKRCPIYMNGKYALTDVIIGRDIKIINPTIQTKIITEREYMTLKKRKKKLKRT